MFAKGFNGKHLVSLHERASLSSRYLWVLILYDTLTLTEEIYVDVVRVWPVMLIKITKNNGSL